MGSSRKSFRQKKTKKKVRKTVEANILALIAICFV